MAFGFFIPTVLLFSLVTFQISSAATCEAGGPQTAQNMAYADGTNTNLYYDLHFNCDGKVTKWIFFAKSTKIFVADAWRETDDGLKLELIGSNQINVTTLGEQTYDVPANEQFEVQANDIIGVRYLTRGDNIGVVPFDDKRYLPYTEGVTLDDFSRIVTLAPADMAIGRQVNISLVQDRTVALRVVVTPPATCEAGGIQTAQDMTYAAGTNTNIFYDLHFNCDGKVTKWIFFAKSTKILFADAWRETDDGLKLELIGSNQIDVTTLGEQTYDVPTNEQFVVKANDSIGIHYLTQGDNNGVVPFDDKRYLPYTEGVTLDDFSRIVTLAPADMAIGRQVNINLVQNRNVALRVVVTPPGAGSK